jgi:hypothetical protein
VASISPPFFDLETLIDTVVENGKRHILIRSDAHVILAPSLEQLNVLGKWYQKSGFSTSDGDTVKRQREFVFPL